jgi:hypothetical protein
MTMAGYAHPGYAESLSEFGVPTLLPRSRGWTLMRPIPDSSQRDLIGLYPFFFCNDWNELSHDLQELADRAVSFSAVTDPLADLNLEVLKSTFDLVLPFKEHFVTDLSRPIEAIVSKSYRATVRRAFRKVEVSLCPDPSALLGDWVRLFGVLARRHGIRGIRAFSERAFSQQLAVPGIVAFEAREIATGEVVGMDLWIVQRDIAYYHLAAFSERGYELSTSYATKWRALDYFSDKVRYLLLGAAPGTGAGALADDGLTKFKRGWSTDTRTNFFCGKILDSAVYAKLVRDNNAEGTSFFPAYRKGVF